MFDSENDDRSEVFVQQIDIQEGLTKDGMTLFLAGMSYARKGGTLSELRIIFDRIMFESNWNDDATALISVRENASGYVPTASSPKPAVQPRPESVVVRPVREPSPGYITAVVAGEKRHAKTLLDKFVLSDGRAILDVCPREFVGYKRDFARIAVLEKHLGELSTRQKNKPIRDLIADFDIAIVKQIQKELSDAA